MAYREVRVLPRFMTKAEKIIEIIKTLISFQKRYVIWIADTKRPPVEGDTITVGKLKATFKKIK